MKKFGFVIIVLILGFSAECFGQTESQVIPTEKKQLTIVTEPSTLFKGFFRLGVSASFYVLDKYFDGEGQRKYFTESSWARSWAMNTIGQYGISDRIMMEIWLPYINESRYYSNYIISPGDDLGYADNWNLKGSGVGDISLNSRIQIFKETDNLPSITGDIGVTLPTGVKNPTEIKDDYDYKLPTGSGETSLYFRIQARKIIYPYSFKFYSDYTYNLGGSKLFNSFDLNEQSFKSGNRISFGASFDFLLNDWIALTNELNYFAFASSQIEGVVQNESSANGISYENRLIFQLGQFRLGEAVRLPITAVRSGANPIYILLVQYVF